MIYRADGHKQHNSLTNTQWQPRCRWHTYHYKSSEVAGWKDGTESERERGTCKGREKDGLCGTVRKRRETRCFSKYICSDMNGARCNAMTCSITPVGSWIQTMEWVCETYMHDDKGWRGWVFLDDIYHNTTKRQINARSRVSLERWRRSKWRSPFPRILTSFARWDAPPSKFVLLQPPWGSLPLLFFAPL